MQAWLIGLRGNVNEMSDEVVEFNEWGSGIVFSVRH
jgi:hypothetical protein